VLPLNSKSYKGKFGNLYMTKKEKTTQKVVLPKKSSSGKTAEEIVDGAVPEINYMEKFQRLQAEFANYEKRTDKEKVDLLNNSNADLISQLLEVLDNFELSLKHNEDKGVQLIYEDLIRVLEKQGLKAIDTEGKFNPEFHEALAQEAGEEEGTILEEFQKGYLLNDKLLRASKVKICTAKK
jgi:molecular chaperone GrpE